MSRTDDADDGAGLFTQRLDELFRTVHGPDGEPYSAKAIVQRASDRGFRIGESYLSQLRSGKAKSPSFRTVEGLAAAFEVDIRHFLEDDRSRRTQAEIEELRAAADPEVVRVAERLSALPAHSLDVVDELVSVLVRRNAVAVPTPAQPVNVVANRSVHAS